MNGKHVVKIGILLAMLVFAVTGCTVGSGVTLNSSSVNTQTKMSMTYEKFTGYRQRTITVEDGSPLTVVVSIVTESGKLDAYIARDNDRALSSYEGNDIPTSSFTVKLTQSGQYTIRVDAEDHSGSYSFSWD